MEAEDPLGLIPDVAFPQLPACLCPSVLGLGRQSSRPGERSFGPAVPSPVVRVPHRGEPRRLPGYPWEGKARSRGDDSLLPSINTVHEARNPRVTADRSRTTGIPRVSPMRVPALPCNSAVLWLFWCK